MLELPLFHFIYSNISYTILFFFYLLQSFRSTLLSWPLLQNVDAATRKFKSFQQEWGIPRDDRWWLEVRGGSYYIHLLCRKMGVQICHTIQNPIWAQGFFFSCSFLYSLKNLYFRLAKCTYIYVYMCLWVLLYVLLCFCF